MYKRSKNDSEREGSFGAYLMRIKKPIFLSVLVFSLSFTALIACAELPDREENGGTGSALPESGGQGGEENGTPEVDEDGEGAAEDEKKYLDGYLLTVDGNALAYIEDKETVKAITDYLEAQRKDALKESGVTVDDVEILNSFELSFTKCPIEAVTDKDGTLDKLEASGLKIVYGVTEREIKPIAYETVYQNSSSYYEGVKKTKTEGKNGEKQITYRVTYSGEEETSRELISEKTTVSPVDKVVLVGTKKSTASTGSYAWPTKNVYITSYYGWRTVFGNREYHYGIDLRASVGTAIYAADGGEVIFVGTSSGYGKLIQIKHDNGDVTYYAHLNSYSVKKGDRVYKGQEIAKSGQTGRVTGPHLHFEIRKNGVRVDPQKYLPKV